MSGTRGSTQDRPDWTAAEEAVVRSLLERAQRDLVVGPAPWPQLHRRRRHTRAGRAGALAAIAACTALVAGLAGGVLPGLDRLPGLPFSRTGVAGLPQGGGTVGSLAGDAAFLAALRPHAVAELVSDGDQPGAGAGTTVDAVLVATDLPGGRMALVSFRFPDGRRMAQWMSGPQGAPARRLHLTSTCNLSEPCWVTYGERPDTEPGPQAYIPPAGTTTVGQGVILAGPRGAKVTVQTGNDVTAAGVVEPITVPAAERWPGVYVAPLDTVDGRQDVIVDVAGAAPWRDSNGGGTSLDIDAWWAAASAPGAARPVTGPVERGDLLTSAQRVTGMVARPGDRVLYQSSRAGDDRAVLAFRGRSGGWALVSVHRTRTSANEFELGVDGARAMPGGDPSRPTAGLDRLCMAWRTPDRGEGRQLQVLGPASARHALLIVPGQGTDSGTIGLDGGFGSVADVPLISQVVLLDGNRHEIGGCEVSLPLKDADLLH